MSFLLFQQNLPFNAVSRFLRYREPTATMPPDAWAAQHARDIRLGDVLFVLEPIFSPWSDGSSGTGMNEGDSFRARMMCPVVQQEGGKLAALALTADRYELKDLETLLTEQAQASMSSGAGFYYAVASCRGSLTPDKAGELANLAPRYNYCGSRSGDDSGKQDVAAAFLNLIGVPVESRSSEPVLDLAQLCFYLFSDREPPPGSSFPDIRAALAPATADAPGPEDAADTRDSAKQTQFAAEGQPQPLEQGQPSFAERSALQQAADQAPQPGQNNASSLFASLADAASKTAQGDSAQAGSSLGPTAAERPIIRGARNNRPSIKIPIPPQGRQEGQKTMPPVPQLPFEEQDDASSGNWQASTGMPAPEARSGTQPAPPLPGAPVEASGHDKWSAPPLPDPAPAEADSHAQAENQRPAPGVHPGTQSPAWPGDQWQAPPFPGSSPAQTESKGPAADRWHAPDAANSAVGQRSGTDAVAGQQAPPAEDREPQAGPLPADHQSGGGERGLPSGQAEADASTGTSGASGRGNRSQSKARLRNAPSDARPSLDSPAGQLFSAMQVPGYEHAPGSAAETEAQGSQAPEEPMAAAEHGSQLGQVESSNLESIQAGEQVVREVAEIRVSEIRVTEISVLESIETAEPSAREAGDELVEGQAAEKPESARPSIGPPPPRKKKLEVTPEGPRTNLLKEPLQVKSGVAGLVSKLEQQASKASARLESQVEEIQERLNQELATLTARVQEAEKESVGRANSLRRRMSDKLENACEDVRNKLAEASDLGRETIERFVDEGAATVNEKHASLAASLNESLDEVRVRAEVLARSFEESSDAKSSKTLAELRQLMESLTVKFAEASEYYSFRLDKLSEHFKSQVEEQRTAIVGSIDQQFTTLETQVGQLHTRALESLDHLSQDAESRLSRIIEAADLDFLVARKDALKTRLAPELRQYRDALRALIGEFQNKLISELEARGTEIIEEFAPILDDKRQQLGDVLHETGQIRETIEQSQRATAEQVQTDFRGWVDENIEEAKRHFSRTEEQITEMDRAVRVLCDPSNIEGDLDLLTERNSVLERMDTDTSQAIQDVHDSLRSNVAALEERAKQLQEELISGMEEDAYLVRKTSEQALSRINEAVKDSFLSIQTTQDEQME